MQPGGKRLTAEEREERERAKATEKAAKAAERVRIRDEKAALKAAEKERKAAEKVGDEANAIVSVSGPHRGMLRIAFYCPGYVTAT